jgi:hypothetical protein
MLRISSYGSLIIAVLTLIAFLPNVLNVFINMNTNKKFKEELKIVIYRTKKEVITKTSCSEEIERENFEYHFSDNKKKFSIPTITISSIRRHSMSALSELHVPTSFRRRSTIFISSFKSIEDDDESQEPFNQHIILD